jgi:anaphase-promoting complex subunit 1
MASVASLGLHRPTGLQYAIQERLLSADPPSTDYTWHNHFEDDGKSTFNDDELLVTPRCVIWSRGGVFRKSYKFDLEKEPVTQALLTSFPSVGPLASKDNNSLQNKVHSSNRATAIVVFLKTQAHVFFLSGTSHVIHLPFEVESASAAPNGLIIQRKLRVDNLVPASLKFPKVPPNSFVSSQPQPWSAASSQLSTFSIADLGGPKQMPIHNSTLKDMWEPPSLKNDANWPRLFSLSDPLAEMGLVVAQPHKSESRRHRRSSIKATSLDTAEEILHVSRRGEFSHRDSEHPLILALTWNRETSAYTVWKVSYVGKDGQKIEKQRVASGTMSRRRSSFVPGTTTGATTPILGSQQTFRESFAGNAPGIMSKKSRQDESRDKVTDFVSSLDPDFEGSTLPRRKSRRVSSMLARSDLSATHERSAFSDLATGHPNTTTRRGESLGSQHGRTSIGAYAGANGSSFAQAPQFNQSLNSYLEAPVDDLLDELRAGGDFEGFHNMGLDDEEFDALRQEIIFSKVCSVPAEHTNVRYSSQHMPAASQSKIFTLTAPPSAADDQQGNTVVICILDSDERKLLVLTLYTKTHKADSDLNGDYTNGTKSEKDVTVVSLGDVMRAKGVIDACRLDDGQVSRMLVLTETPDGYGELSLQAPWSVLMKVPLPAKFTISNIRDLGHDATPRAKREGGFKRVLSQGPRALRGLCNPKPRGIVDLIDDDGKMHQLQIVLEPRNPHVRRILEVCRAVVAGKRGGEGILVGWWNVMQWLRLESIDVVDMEWSALVVTLFSMVLGLNNTLKPTQNRTHTKRKSRTGPLRSSSGAQSDQENWEIMHTQETSNGNPSPSWADNSGWKWLVEEDDLISQSKDSNASSPIFMSQRNGKTSFLQHHVRLAKDFAGSSFGHDVVSGCLPSSGNRTIEARKTALTDAFIGLHLLREEQKLNTMESDAFSTGNSSLTPILIQIARWLGWKNWVQTYEVEEASLLDADYDTGKSKSLRVIDRADNSN